MWLDLRAEPGPRFCQCVLNWDGCGWRIAGAGGEPPQLPSISVNLCLPTCQILNCGPLCLEKWVFLGGEWRWDYVQELNQEPLICEGNVSLLAPIPIYVSFVENLSKIFQSVPCQSVGGGFFVKLFVLNLNSITDYLCDSCLSFLIWNCSDKKIHNVLAHGRYFDQCPTHGIYYEVGSSKKWMSDHEIFIMSHHSGDRDFSFI